MPFMGMEVKFNTSSFWNSRSFVELKAQLDACPTSSWSAGLWFYAFTGGNNVNN
jgi:hypothetical protein